MRRKPYGIYFLASLIVAFGSVAAILAAGWEPALGLDLEGGTSVILTAEGEVTDDVLQKTTDIIRSRIDSLGVAESEVSVGGEDNILIQLPGVENERRALEVIGTTAQLTFRQVEEIIPANAPEKRTPEVTEDVGTQVNDQEVVYPSGQEGDEGALYRLKPAELTGDIVTQASAVLDTQATGGWLVTLEMNDEGSATWESFTDELACLRDEGEQIKSRVAIVLDGVVQSAPGMDAGVACGTGIAGGETQITVGGNEQEAKDLALVLRTGSLPITLVQSEVRKISPTLGSDSLTAGLQAGAIGLGLVMIYMLLYYRALGLVVWLGLFIFAASLYALVTALSRSAGLSLSLAGVAGLIVSLGVTADSYIVAFERLKDEVRSGKTMRAAVERGMSRAFRTILVADFVTGSAAVILFFLAVGPVRGFALTLGLATLIDVLVAYFYTRSAVHLLARTKLFSSGRFIGMRDALGVEGTA